jgi:hypothetical protein
MDWPSELAATYGDSVVVAPRILTGVTTGARLVHAMDVMGVRIASLKQSHPTVGPSGIQVDLGRIVRARE